VIGDHPVSEGCRYQVTWSINPHMRIGTVDHVRACAQHVRLLDIVRSLGASVTCLPFVHGGFDSVFAKDNALYLARDGQTRAVLGAFRHDVRAIEQQARARDLMTAGILVEDRPPAFEGGDLCVLPGRAAWLGYGFRSSREASVPLRDVVGTAITPLELVDPDLYHLDTALVVLADGTVLACAEAFAPASRRALVDSAPGEVVWVSRAAAVQFALNLVEVGDAIVTGTDAPEITGALSARGKRIIVTPLDEFQRAGGSAACLLAPVHELGAALAVAA
jgi:N-dimethylarginine dimethylaminohydrolase